VPGDEIERLFSAPVSRGDLVRYRLMVNVARAALGGVILGMVLLRYMPNPLFAFLAAFLALETLPVLGQIAAIWSGALERKVYRRLKLVRGLAVPLALLVGVSVAGLAFGGQGDLGRWFSSIAADGFLLDLANHPVTEKLTLPFAPWANAVTATTWSGFGLWFGLSLAIWIALYELAARIPVDFRELSLQTSADVADRLRRMRRVGGGASAGKVSRRTLGVRVPWILGRGPAGAVAWRKVGSILRKARGTLVISSLVLVFVVVLSRLVFSKDHDDESRIAGQAMVAVLGLIYLAGGLRFDFRDELDRMESIKAWPLSPRRVFFAMLFPEAVLISVLIGLAILVAAVLAGGLELFTLGMLAVVPLVAFAWIALDNAVFLYAPVRMVPGQEGLLQNAGRGFLLLFVRLLLVTIVVALTAAPGALVWWGIDALTGSETLAIVGAFAVGWIALVLADLGLCELGAWAFRRFDVARDRS
jgi:hypothetical protein